MKSETSVFLESTKSDPANDFPRWRQTVLPPMGVNDAGERRRVLAEFGVEVH